MIFEECITLQMKSMEYQDNKLKKKNKSYW